LLDNILRKINYIVGCLIMVAGVLACILIVTRWTLEVPSYLDVTYREPHPYRWIAGIAVLILSFLSTIIFISIGKIIELLSELLSSLKQSSQKAPPNTPPL